MTPFDFVFFLYAIMLSLGITHLISGWATALRNAKVVRWSMPPLTWALITLFYTTGNLTSFWLMRDSPAWPAGLVLGNFGFAIINYGLCVLVTPEVDRGATLDLGDFHDRESRRYLAALIALLVTAILNNFAIGMFANYEHCWSDSLSSLAAGVPTLAAMRWRQWPVQVAAAVIVLAISTYFLMTSSSILL